MHKGAIEFLGQTKAVANICAAVTAKWPAAAQLSDHELESRFPKRRYLAGWIIPGDLVSAPRDLLLLLPGLYPHALPVVALLDNTKPAELPHVEIDGVLCLNSGGTLMELPADFRHVEYVISEASRLLEEGLRGQNRTDFLDEISTYWTLDQPYIKPIWLATNNLQKTCTLQAANVKNAILVADDSAHLNLWQERVYPTHAKANQFKVAFIALPNPIFPENYPTNTEELSLLVKSAGADAVELLSHILQPGLDCHVVLAFMHNCEQLLVGLRASIGNRSDTDTKHPTQLWKGFRKGKIPEGILAQRIFDAKFPVTRCSATRITSEALLQRTTGAQASSFLGMNVAIIGCGALGGSVAQMLAQAGIRRLTLIDDDQLTWQNIGRHVLPGNYVYRGKSEALQADILMRFPDYEVDAVTTKWQAAWQKDPEFFDKYDLVVALTAEWISDDLLNKLTNQTTYVPPVIWGWVEAYGLAGHALAVLPNGGCLRCLTDQVGEFQYPVSVVSPELALKREPSCGAFYQPFSAVSASPTAAMVSRMVLEALAGKIASSELHTWVGPKGDFDQLDAGISPQWVDVLSEKGFERVYRRPITKLNECSVCNKQS